MFRTLKAAQVLGWYGRYGINGINGITVLTPPPKKLGMYPVDTQLKEKTK